VAAPVTAVVEFVATALVPMGPEDRSKADHTLWPCTGLEDHQFELVEAESDDDGDHPYVSPTVALASRHAATAVAAASAAGERLEKGRKRAAKAAKQAAVSAAKKRAKDRHTEARVP